MFFSLFELSILFEESLDEEKNMQSELFLTVTLGEEGNFNVLGGTYSANRIYIP